MGSVPKDGAELEESISKFTWEPRDLELVDEDGNPLGPERPASTREGDTSLDLTDPVESA